VKQKDKTPSPPPLTPPLQKRGAHLASWQTVLLGSLAATSLSACFPDPVPPQCCGPQPGPDYWGPLPETDAGQSSSETGLDGGNIDFTPQPPQPEQSPDAGVSGQQTSESDTDAGGDDGGVSTPVPDVSVDAGSADDSNPPPQPPPQAPPET
tara:strand:- start:2156 stop:2611 length:456 start_codon:yes stop_codon:yes gene_type:complete